MLICGHRKPPFVPSCHIQVNLTFEDEECCPGKLIKPVLSISLCLAKEQGHRREGVRTSDQSPALGAWMQLSFPALLANLGNHENTQGSKEQQSQPVFAELLNVPCTGIVFIES